MSLFGKIKSKLNNERFYDEVKDQVINKLDAYKQMPDKQLQKQTGIFQKKLSNGSSLDSILPDAFATVIEADRRILQMQPYPVQILGGVVLHYGNLAEMATGEGKTLTATMPVYLNALEHKGVSIVTVNDYLSNRDFKQMSQIYRWLGLTVGYVNEDMEINEKKIGYSSDITFATSSTIGFDYLNDNLAGNLEEQVHPKMNFAIIDEADSVLIDAASNPLIIAGEPHGIDATYNEADLFVKSLSKNDYEVKDEDKICYLTESGITKAERWYNVPNLYSKNNTFFLHYLQLALNAEFVYKRDQDYTVENGKVILIDQGTGRADTGSRLEYGQHQALEAKEQVMVNDESDTLSSITYQSLFRMYHKLAGMTGTGRQVEEELHEMYGMNVITIPTNNPIIRIDHHDQMYQTKRAKLRALLKFVIKIHQTKRPILLASDSVRNSEILNKLLLQLHLPHKLLNVHNSEKEAEIIKDAGQLNSILVSTGMAGRGTDIKLGQGVKEIGGLYVIGSERYENSRVDDQLRGRSGRQGDPGDSIFFTSLEDDILIQNANEKLVAYKEKHKLDKNAINALKKHSPRFMRYAINDAQDRITGQKHSQRLEGFKFDDLLQPQREEIYHERQLLLTEQTAFIKEFISSSFKLNHNIKKNYQLALSAAKNQNYDQRQWLNFLKNTILDSIDNAWSTHLDFSEQLKVFVRMRTYAQLNPIFEYYDDIRKSFNFLLEDISDNFNSKLIKFAQNKR